MTDDFFVPDPVEKDMKEYNKKWKAIFEKQKYKNEIGKLHVYDPSFLSKQLKRNLSTLEHNLKETYDP